MKEASSSSVLRDARRIVVKVGSSLVTNEGKGLDEVAIASGAARWRRLPRRTLHEKSSWFPVARLPKA